MQNEWEVRHVTLTSYCREAATTTLGPAGPVKPKNLPAKDRSNLRTLPRPTGAKPSESGPHCGPIS